MINGALQDILPFHSCALKDASATLCFRRCTERPENVFRINDLSFAAEKCRSDSGSSYGSNCVLLNLTVLH